MTHRLATLLLATTIALASTASVAHAASTWAVEGNQTALSTNVIPENVSTQSGYMEDFSANVTGASGTFTVPVSSPASPIGSKITPWVGVQDSSGDLLQAGVMVTPGDQDFAWYVAADEGTTTTSNYYAIPIPKFAVGPNDSITVALSQVSDGTWDIALTDNTTGQATNFPEAYDGGSDIAEWITEDPGSPTGNEANEPYTDCTPAPLDQFTNVIAWSNVQVTAPSNSWEAPYLAQFREGNGDSGSAPIANTLLTGGAFTQFYSPAAFPNLLAPANVPTAASSSTGRPVASTTATKRKSTSKPVRKAPGKKHKKVVKKKHTRKGTTSRKGKK